MPSSQSKNRKKKKEPMPSTSKTSYKKKSNKSTPLRSKKTLNGLMKLRLMILKPPSSKKLKILSLEDSLPLSYNPKLKSKDKSSLKSPNISILPKKLISKLKE